MLESVWLPLLILIIGVIIYLFTAPSKPPHPAINLIKEKISKVDPKFEKIPMKEGGSSYTENKSIVYLCLKNPKTGVLYSMNTLIYVALHEVAHVLSKSYGHGEEWQRIFHKLTQEAIHKGIYDPSRPVPTDYCGMAN